MSKEFSNGELQLMFEHIKEHNKYVEENLRSIEEQTKKTNGRVSKLEKWQSYVFGATAVLTVIIIPVVFEVVKQWLKTVF